jgi:amino acid transporter
MLRRCLRPRAGDRSSHGYVIIEIQNPSNLTSKQVTGWSNFLGLLTAPCSVNYALAAMILTAAEIGNPNYQIETWHVYLTLLALLVFQGSLSMNSTKFTGRLNFVGAIINVVVVFIFIIWMLTGSIQPFNSNDKVWTSKGFVNGTEWPTGFAFLMGFLSVIVSLDFSMIPTTINPITSNAEST